MESSFQQAFQKNKLLIINLKSEDYSKVYNKLYMIIVKGKNPYFWEIPVTDSYK